MRADRPGDRGACHPTPPQPIACASLAAHSRRPRSSSVGFNIRHFSRTNFSRSVRRVTTNVDHTREILSILGAPNRTMFDRLPHSGALGPRHIVRGMVTGLVQLARCDRQDGRGGEPQSVLHHPYYYLLIVPVMAAPAARVKPRTTSSGGAEPHCHATRAGYLRIRAAQGRGAPCSSSTAAATEHSRHGAQRRRGPPRECHEIATRQCAG